MRRNSSISKDTAIAAAKYAREEEYWLEQLSGELTRSCIPYDSRNKSAGKEAAGLVPLEFVFPGELFDRLVKLSNGVDYTIHITLAALVTLLLHKYTASPDIIVGVPIYKQESDAQFINTALPIRSMIDSDMTFKKLLLQVRQTIIDAEKNQNYPIEILFPRLDIPHADNEDDYPIFDTAVLLESIHDKKYLSHTRINMIYYFIRESMKCIVEYNPASYHRDTIERMTRRFLKLMGDCLFNTDVLLNDLELGAEEEKKQLLYDFNDTYEEYDRDKTIVQLFEEQVHRTPHRIAAECTNEQITYRELNNRANNLAIALRLRGIAPNTIAAIIEERSIAMAVNIIAILKAGGAYMPINPETPKRRLASLLDDAAVSLVLARNRGLGNYLFTTLQGLRSFHEIPYYTEARPPIQDLDNLIPDRSLVDYSKYNRYIGQCMARDAIVIQASRGCPYHCAYCHKIWPKKQVFRSPESIFAEVKQNYDLGMRKFAFVDDIFNLNKKTGSRFFELIIAAGLNVQFFFPNGLRGDLLTPDYIDLMVEAGVVSLALALETGSPRLQKVLGKNLDLVKFRENIEYLCKAHPQVILELFTMHGFPGETEEEALMTLEFVKSLHWVHFPYMNVLKIYPHTDMERIALEHGISREAIRRSEDYAHYELSDISPFDRNFSFSYRSIFLNDYFLFKERLLHVLPFQVKILSLDELLQKYNSYLPTETGIHSFDSLLEQLKITREELLKAVHPQTEDASAHLVFAPEGDIQVYQKNLQQNKMQHYQPPDADALRVLLLDLSQFFSFESEFFYDVSGEAPLGLMYLATYLQEQLGARVNVKIAKSRVDFDSYDELQRMYTEFKPDVIGVRSLNIYKDFLHKVITIARQWGFAGPLIAGGPYPTSDTASLLQDGNIDLVVLSEGEVTFHELIQEIIRNQGQLPPHDILKNIKGIAYIPPEKKTARGICRQVVLFDELAQESNSQFPGNIENIEPVNLAHDPAYVIFTSGSTGEPKGSIIPHGNVGNLIHGLKQHIYRHYRGSLKIAQVAPYFFDASIKQVFAALLQGYCLSIVPDETRGDGRLLAEYYARCAVDVSDCTPTHLYLLMESSSTGKLDFPVKRFIIGGEALQPKIAADFLKCFAAHTPTLTNIYGVTECTVDSTSYTIDPDNIPPYDAIPIGKPMSNSRIYIQDRQNKLQPIGIMGELCIAGHGVGTGYLNRPELTAEKFVSGMQGGSFRENHPPAPPAKALDKSFWRSRNLFSKRFLVAEGNYLYKTGDLARWRPDGNIEFVGRADYQVKIRGYRLELGEIENNLLKHPQVSHAVVLAKTDKDGDRFLCAYVVPKTADNYKDRHGIDEQGFSAAVREFLSAHIPTYMIPTYIIPLHEIPLTPNGKINRRALPEPRIGDGGAAYLAPSTPVEEKLVQIWADVLKIEPGKISIDADFFDMGGHSLRATIMVSRIHKAFDTRIPLQKIFEKPTIRGIADFIGKSAKEKFANIRSIEKREYYPLSSAQGRLYVVQQMDEEIASYTTLMVVVITGKLSIDRLRNAFAGLFERHNSLRTYFEVIDGRPRQRIAGQISLHLEQYAMTEEQGAEFAQKTFSRPFDLSKPPLIRVGLIKIEETRHIMAISIHHIIADGSSVGMLMREFMQIYEEKPLPHLRLRYVDYSRQQNSKEQKEAIRLQEQYWLEQFEKEVPKLNLPTDFPRPPIRKFSGSSVDFRIQPEETKRIKDLAAREDVTLYMFLLAVFNVFLFKITGREDILVGTPAANRRHTDLEPIIGMFANIIVMRNFPARQRQFRSFLKETRQRTLQAFDNQDYKLEDLVEQVVKEKDLSRHPLFDVLFSLQNMEFPRVRFSDLSMEQLEHTLWAARADLVFVAFELPDAPEIGVLVEYNTPLFKEETIQAFIADFKAVLAAILADPDTRLQDIEIAAPHIGHAETGAGRLRELDLGF